MIQKGIEIQIFQDLFILQVLLGDGSICGIGMLTNLFSHQSGKNELLGKT